MGPVRQHRHNQGAYFQLDPLANPESFRLPARSCSGCERSLRSTITSFLLHTSRSRSRAAVFGSGSTKLAGLELMFYIRWPIYKLNINCKMVSSSWKSLMCCFQCAKQIQGSTVFCPTCGTKVPLAKEPEPSVALGSTPETVWKRKRTPAIVRPEAAKKCPINPRMEET